MEGAENILGRAILSLQERLGLTQEAMARKLDVSLRGYTQWIRGERDPGGKWIVKILQLWHDEKTLGSFGIHNSEWAEPAPADPYDDLFKNLREIINSGQSQLIGQAEEVLARLADNARYMTRKSKKNRK